MKKLPTMYEQFLKLADIDISSEPMEVFPTVHYTMGGSRSTPRAPPPACQGFRRRRGGRWSARREPPRGNSLSDLLVFGRRAGEGAAAYIEESVHSAEIDEGEVLHEIGRVLEPLEKQGEGESPYLIQQELQEAMMEHANLMRDGDSLKEGLGKILALKDRLPQISVGSRLFNPLAHGQDVRYLVQISHHQDGLERKERRGAQWRLTSTVPTRAREDQLYREEGRPGRGRHRAARDTADARTPGVARRGGEGEGMSEGNGNNPGGVTSKAHSPVPNEELGISGKMAKLKIFRGDAEGGEEVEYEIPRRRHGRSRRRARDPGPTGPDGGALNCKAAHCGP